MYVTIAPESDFQCLSAILTHRRWLQPASQPWKAEIYQSIQKKTKCFICPDTIPATIQVAACTHAIKAYSSNCSR